MKTNTNCCSASASPCDSSIAELPRYYPRQLITPDDLTLEQNYFRDRMRRHNRLLHGWGVVCGALVCPVPNPKVTGPSDQFLPWQVKVQQGYILGPYGDEIIIDCERTVDIRSSGTTGITGQPCLDAPDPWCSQIFVVPDKSVVYIAVKYRQCMTRPVRVQPVGCGCDDTSCEYSRWQDGYEIGVLLQCPSCNDGPPSVGLNPDGTVSLDLIPKGEEPACPDCSCGPWVGLAEINFDANGNITKINNCSCRRLVLSFSRFWWSCQGPNPTITQVVPQTAAAGTSDLSVTVTGTNFRCGATAQFDNPNFTVVSAYVKNPQTLILTVNISANATSKDSNPEVTVANLDKTPPASFATGIKVTDAIASPAPANRTASKVSKSPRKPAKARTPEPPE
jgi:hypothetical protein